MLRGLRIQLAGSAARTANKELLNAAHLAVQSITLKLIECGAGMVVGVGGEPIGDAGVPCVFDWTVLENLSKQPDPAPGWPKPHSARFRVVASQPALQSVPESRESVWSSITGRSDFDLETLPPGWRMGGAIRSRQVGLGDILVVLGGGAGSEQLATLYIEDGKPVVPIRCDLGSIVGDGRGGSSFLHAEALSQASQYFSLRDGVGSAAGRLSTIRLEPAYATEQLSTDLVSLLEDIRPPLAFYVRLLAHDHPDYDRVEMFFREVVDPVITEMGFTSHEVGTDRPLAGFMNVEIFRALHVAGLAIVDLTGVRPNCMMELGYALGRGRRVVISAARGTELPFDPDKLPTFLWDTSSASDRIAADYRNWIERHFDMPPVVD